jgi:thioredoxin 1
MNSRSNRREPIHKTYGDMMGTPAVPPQQSPSHISTPQTPTPSPSDTPYLQSLRQSGHVVPVNTNIQQRMPMATSASSASMPTPISSAKSRPTNDDACIIVTSPQQLDDLMSNHLLVLDIWAEWCGPCKKCAPEFEQLAREFKEANIKFAKVLVEDFMEWTGASVSSVPTFMFFKDGKKFKEVYGFQKVQMGGQVHWEGVAHIITMLKK